MTHDTSLITLDSIISSIMGRRWVTWGRSWVGLETQVSRNYTFRASMSSWSMLAQRSPMMASIEGLSRCLHATPRSSGVGEGPLPWDDHQALRVPENEMPSESEWSTSPAITVRYRTVVQTSGSVNISPKCSQQCAALKVSIENEWAKHVVLRFQVTTKGCRLHTMITDVALYPEPRVTSWWRALYNI